MQTTFFERALEGIPEHDMHNRLNTKANHMAWLADSLVAQRYQMDSDTRPDLKQTQAELFKDNNGIEDATRYPANIQYLEDWKTITPFSRQEMIMIDDQKLDSEIDSAV